MGEPIKIESGLSSLTLVEREQLEERFGVPVPLDNTAGPTGLPPYPVECLPAVQRRFVEEISREIQAPIDFAAQVTMAAVSTAMSRKFAVRVRGGWVEGVNLFLLTAGLSSDRKSSVLRPCVKPMFAWESAEHDEMRGRTAAALAELDVLRGRLTTAKKKAEKSNDAMTDVAELAEAIDERERRVPRARTLFSDDVTPEALAELMEQQDERIAIVSAEGGLLDSIAGGRYSDGLVNLDVYLKAYSGDFMRVNRKGKRTIHLDHPALTVCLMAQPRVIKAAAANELLRARGFLGRFLFSWPQSLTGYRSPGQKAADKGAVKAWDALMLSLLQVRDVRGAGRKIDTPVVELDEMASAAMLDFEREIERQLAPGEDLSHVVDWASRLPGQVIRIAGCLAAADCGGVPPVITLPHFERAVKIGRYHLEHAQRTFAAAEQEQATDAAMDVWARIHKAGFTTADGFTKRDLHRKCQRQYTKSAQLDEPLRLLLEARYLFDGDRPGHYRANLSAPPVTAPKPFDNGGL